MLRTGFAPRAKGFSLYLNGCQYQYDSPKIKAMLAKLGPHSHGKGCLYIFKLADVDQSVLKKLITLSWEMKIKYEVK